MQRVAESGATELAVRLASLERDIDEGRYRPGLWQPLLRDVRRLPRPDRVALQGAISRVSDKLHARKGVRRIPFRLAVLGEFGTVFLGAVLLGVALRYRSGWAAVLAALAWALAFQPLIKMLVGSALGIRYNYAYLLGPEPRFKMRYGSYLAAGRSARIAFHLSGMIGSPLGAWLPIPFLGPEFRGAITICWSIVAVCVALNIVPLVLALLGFERVGSLNLSLGSAGSAALEIREPLARG